MKAIYHELLQYHQIKSNNMLSFMASKSNILKEIRQEQHRMCKLWSQINHSAIIIQFLYRRFVILKNMRMSLNQLLPTSMKQILNEFTFCQKTIHSLPMKYIYKYLIVPNNRLDYKAYRYYIFDLRELAAILQNELSTSRQKTVLLNPYTGLVMRQKDISMILELIKIHEIKPIDHENSSEEELSESSKISSKIAQLSNVFLQYHNYTKVDFLLYFTKQELKKIVTNISRLDSVDLIMNIENFYQIVLSRNTSQKELLLLVLDFILDVILKIEDKTQFIIGMGNLIETTFYYLENNVSPSI